MKPSSNIRQFQKAIAETMKVTKKTESEVINRACRNVAFRAASFTPKTTASAIKSKFRKDDLLAKLASRNLKQKQGRFTRAEHKAEMKRLTNKAVRAIAAVRASWAGAIIAMGGQFRGKRPKPGTDSARGSGRKASPSRLLASIWSAIVTTSGKGKVTSAIEIRPLRAALVQAVDFVSQDMVSYARRKIRETLQKHSSKK